MTVSELIEQLKTLPGDMEVQVVTGGWGGSRRYRRSHPRHLVPRR